MSNENLKSKREKNEKTKIDSREKRQTKIGKFALVGHRTKEIYPLSEIHTNKV